MCHFIDHSWSTCATSLFSAKKFFQQAEKLAELILRSGAKCHIINGDNKKGDVAQVLPNNRW
jgi:hypothetical protein